jgi:hypothetical protein
LDHDSLLIGVSQFFEHGIIETSSGNSPMSPCSCSHYFFFFFFVSFSIIAAAAPPLDAISGVALRPAFGGAAHDLLRPMFMTNSGTRITNTHGLRFERLI